jgi:hypothetical protein
LGGGDERGGNGFPFEPEFELEEFLLKEPLGFPPPDLLPNEDFPDPPAFFVQVSLLSNRDPIIGIIYDPVSRQLFSASLGNGSFLNGEKLINKSTVHLSNAVIDVDLGGKEDIDWKLEALKNLVKESYRVRVSAGRFALVIVPEGNVQEKLPVKQVFSDAYVGQFTQTER